MRVLLDTNVLISGIFFGGRPREILNSWAEGRFELVLSPEIYDEYLRVCERLAETRPHLSYQAVLARLVGGATLVPDPEGDRPITSDPDDDKFMRCALQAGALIVSGDSHLLEASGWEGVEVLTPAAFLDSLPA